MSPRIFPTAQDAENAFYEALERCDLEAMMAVWAEDEEFGLYLWTAFTTGARRGEVSALRENRFDFTRQQVRLARNYLVKQGQHIEKAPRTERAASCPWTC